MASTAVKERRPSGAARDLIVDYLRQQGEATAGELAEVVGYAPVTTLRALVEQGAIKRVSRGVYTLPKKKQPVNNGSIATIYDRKRSVDRKVADALAALDIKQPDTLLLLQWLDLSKELIASA